MINGMSEHAYFQVYCYYSRNSLVPVRYLRGGFPDKRNKGVLPWIDYIVNFHLSSLHIMNLLSPDCLSGKFNGIFPPVVKPLSHERKCFSEEESWLLCRSRTKMKN